MAGKTKLETAVTTGPFAKKNFIDIKGRFDGV